MRWGVAAGAKAVQTKIKSKSESSEGSPGERRGGRRRAERTEFQRLHFRKEEEKGALKIAGVKKRERSLQGGRI